MCTIISKNASKNIRRFRQKGGKVVLWKICNKYGGKLCAPIRLHFYQVGQNVSSRPEIDLSNIEISSGKVNLGFHFFRSKRAANLYKQELNGKLLRVKVDRSQVVCLGKNQFTDYKHPLNDLPTAVVYSFRISQKEYRDVINA